MQVELKSRVCSVESCLDSNCGVYSAKCGAYSGVKHSVKCILCEPHLPILTMRWSDLRIFYKTEISLQFRPSTDPLFLFTTASKTYKNTLLTANYRTLRRGAITGTQGARHEMKWNEMTARASSFSLAHVHTHTTFAYTLWWFGGWFMIVFHCVNIPVMLPGSWRIVVPGGGAPWRCRDAARQRQEWPAHFDCADFCWSTCPCCAGQWKRLRAEPEVHAEGPIYELGVGGQKIEEFGSSKPDQCGSTKRRNQRKETHCVGCFKVTRHPLLSEITSREKVMERKRDKHRYLKSFGSSIFDTWGCLKIWNQFSHGPSCSSFEPQATPLELADTIRKCINTPSIHAKAKEVAEQMKKEDASARLVEVIKDYMESHIRTGKHMKTLEELEQKLGSRVFFLQMMWFAFIFPAGWWYSNMAMEDRWRLGVGPVRGNDSLCLWRPCCGVQTITCQWKDPLR